MKEQTNTEALDTIIKASEAMTPDKIEALNNACRIAMADSLCKSVSRLDEVDNLVNSVTSQLAAFVATSVQAQIDSQALTVDQAVNLLDKLSNLTVRSAETKRKIFNGREMFQANPLSAKEQALMELLKGVNTDSKRKALESFLDTLNSDEFQE